MKTFVKILAVLLIVSSCKPDAEKIKKQIAKKKAEIQKIDLKIADLEKKLASLDTAIKKSDAHLVAIEEVKEQPFSHYIEVQGSIDGDNNIAVFPEAMGVIEQVYVKPGEHVVKGQLLASLNDGAISDQIKALETSLNMATTVYEKQKTLWDQKIGSEVQYLQAKSTKENLESQLAATKNQQAMFHIKSPINGTVEDAPVKVGQTASPQLPAFRIVNFGMLKAVTDVAEAYASKIKNGDEILVFLPDIKKDYKARVNFASNFINQVNRTFRVEAILKESDPNMKANMVAILKINDYSNQKAIILPINYVQKDQKGNFVFVAEKSGNDLKASKRSVTTGQIYNGVAEITSGLKAGDQVITLGYLDVEEGENVRL